MASSAGHGSLVVSSNLTSTMKTFFKESEFLHVHNLINRSLPRSPEIVKNCEARAVPYENHGLPRCSEGEKRVL